jgi:hypothetical protein
VWAAQRPGAIELAPRLRPGEYRIVVSAAAQGAPTGPTLRIQLDGGAGVTVPMDAAVAPTWRERDYATEIAWRGGRLPIRIELAQVSGTAPAQLAYVRAIEVTAAEGAAQGPAARGARQAAP